MITSMENVTHIIVPDLHGNLGMAERILTTSGAAAVDPGDRFERLHIKEEMRVTFLGDLADRGDDSLAVLSMVHRLQGQGATVLAGNHEAAMHAAVRGLTPRAVAEWCVMGGAAVLKEMAVYRGLMHGSMTAKEPIAGVDAYIQNSPRGEPLTWEEVLKKVHAEHMDTKLAMDALRAFYEKRARALFERTEILTRPLPGVMAIHAGLDIDALGMGSTNAIAAAWRTFRMGKDTARLLRGKQDEPNVMAFREALWLRRGLGNDVLIGRQMSSRMLDEGTNLVIRGHDRTESKSPELLEEYKGVFSIDVDGGANGDCYVKITPDGTVLGGSALKGEQHLGDLKNGVFRPDEDALP